MASLADAGLVTVGVTDLADAGVVSQAAPLILLMVWSVIECDRVSGCRLESGVERGLRFRITWTVSTLTMRAVMRSAWAVLCRPMDALLSGCCVLLRMI